MRTISLSYMFWLSAVVSVIFFCSCCKGIQQTKEDEARAYLGYLSTKYCARLNEFAVVDWAYYTNVTEENLKRMDEVDAKPDIDPEDIIYFDWRSFNDTDLLRQARFYEILDVNATTYFDDQLAKDYNLIIDKLVHASSVDIKVCEYKKPTVCGDEVKDLLPSILENSHDADEMEFYWAQNREGAPRIARPLYSIYVNLSNTLSRGSNFSDTAEAWLDDYGGPKFEKQVLDIYEQFRPLYSQFVSYIRGRIRARFGEKAVSKKGPVPIYLFTFKNGDVVGSRNNLKYLKPFPNKPSIDVTDELKRQNYTVLNIAEKIEDFYTSMGLEPLPSDFWENSQFAQPTDRKVFCDYVSFDFFNQKRLLGCGKTDLFTIVNFAHEMGHLHNFYAYRFQPCCYRFSPGTAQAEAVAGTMVLPFTSFTHLQKLGLLDECQRDEEMEINSFFTLFRQSLGLLPLVLVDDVWRYKLFRNQVDEKDYNKAYWEIRKQYQGVGPPANRSEEYLDAAMRLFMLNGSPTVSYLIMYILQYQYYEALCITAGQYDPNCPESNPLHNCDLYGSKEAGKKWNDMLKLGASKPWKEVMKIVLGKSELDAGPALRYFDTFHKWLIKENKKNNEFIGWE